MADSTQDRKKGNRLPSPLQMAQNKKAEWIKTTLTLYGKQVKLWYQTLDALWYPSAGQQHAAGTTFAEGLVWSWNQ